MLDEELYTSGIVTNNGNARFLFVVVFCSNCILILCKEIGDVSLFFSIFA